MVNEKTGLKKIIKISSNIIQLNYRTPQELCNAFCRFEEHYESPEFKGKIFTLGQYKEWYCDRYGAWSYNSDWSGFNLPSESLQPFFKGLFDPLSEAEQEIVDLFKTKEGKYYVIGTSDKSDPDVLEHEVCHAMFSCFDNYKKDVLTVLNKKTKSLEKLKKHLLDIGYADSVLLDEVNAYICESSSYLDEKGIDYPKELVPILKDIKNKYKNLIKN